MTLPTEQELYNFLKNDDSIIEDIEDQTEYINNLTKEIVSDSDFSKLFKIMLIYQNVRGIDWFSIIVSYFAFGVFVGTKYSGVSKEIDELDKLLNDTVE